MPPQPLTIYIVDDDAAVRDSLALMLGLAGFSTAFFADAEAFLAAWREDWSGCVVADLRLPGLTGLELQAELGRRGSRLPFIIITAHGDVPAARAAFRADAVDFLEKPFDHAQLRAAIQNAFSKEHLRLARSADAGRLARLTGREREVLAAAAQGLHAKEIGRQLGISPRTVEVHKTRIMAKLGARNVAELVRLALAAEPPPDAG
ncbi:MAG: response regulator transcription factor [Burkholderiales bacterium]|nr:response regulator transcription factor [Burkholderiales bacterium]